MTIVPAGAPHSEGGAMHLTLTAIPMEPFLAQPEVPLDFVLPGFLAGTVGALISPGGMGKSYWALAMACGLAAGELSKLGLPRPSHPGRVCYFSAEDPKVVLHQRLLALRAAGHPVDLMQGRLQLHGLLEGEHGRPSLTSSRWHSALARAGQGARLIVLDTLSRFHSLDENDAGQASEIMMHLERLATLTGAAVLYLHHTSKGAALQGQGALQQAARGSSVLTDNARWAAYLAPATEQHKPTLGSRSLHPGPYVRWNISKQNYGPPVEDCWFARTETGVLSLLRVNEEQPQPEAVVSKEPGGVPAQPGAAVSLAPRTSKDFGNCW